MPKEIKVLDIFCGAGGFSEGFRQCGFKIIMGIDNWKYAVLTHNHNFNLNGSPQDVLSFDDAEMIEALPDTEVIVGSPPCVSFSNSNKSGGGDKALGIRLIESYLRIVAVKKHKNESILKAWLMENVVNSKHYLKDFYTFKDLNLKDWALTNSLNPNNVALNVRENGVVINSVDYGSAQKRKRYICGELTETGEFPYPDKVVGMPITLSYILEKMPSPSSKESRKICEDPNYEYIKMRLNDITDHFYDSGVYHMEWESAEFYKINHPFMGKMAFPEDPNNPSRTIMATQTRSSREAMLLLSEHKRSKDGKYRSLTIREAACLMGFPYSYQFCGQSEGTKYRLVGNAVCVHVSYALASNIAKYLNLKPDLNNHYLVNDRNKEESLTNLNSYSVKEFNKHPSRRKNSKFRRHPFKNGGITVSMLNYDITRSNSVPGRRWFVAVHKGTGVGYRKKILKEKDVIEAKNIIKESCVNGVEFIDSFNNEFKEVVGKTSDFQELYSKGPVVTDLMHPITLVKEIANFINKYDRENTVATMPKGLELIIGKQEIPKKQLYAIYGLGKILYADL